MQPYPVMSKNKLKIFYIVLCLIQLITINHVFADEPTQFSFINNSSVILRDANLRYPRSIESGSQITIDPQYLLENIGTATPSQEQIQRLLLNPGEASHGKIGTRRFYNHNSKRPRNDYFFPVTIKTKTGEVKTGTMAFHAYNRMGLLELKRSDGQDPTKFQSAETTEQLATLIELNRETTEAQNCESCSQPALTREQQLANLMVQVTRRASMQYDIWNRFQQFAKEFNTTHGRISKSRAGYYKRLYIKTLVDRFGARDAGLMLAALTGFAEAPHRSSESTQIAEVAAVLKVIDNRADRNFRSRSRTLRDIGISESADARLTNILADWQFSAWNDRDNNLTRMLNFNPDTSDLITKRKVMLAFDAQEKINTGRIQFVGNMNNSRLMHYHANYVNPNWDRAANRVNSPTIIVDGVSVDLSRQNGARHIFYAGIS